MNTIRFRFGIEVIDANCTGCYRCERVCPTEAIVMVGPKTAALAAIDNDKCIACVPAGRQAGRRTGRADRHAAAGAPEAADESR